MTIPIGKALRTARKKSSFSLEALSILTGISESYLSNIETGRRQPTLDTLSKICIPLEIEVSELITEAEYLAELCCRKTNNALNLVSIVP